MRRRGRADGLMDDAYGEVLGLELRESPGQPGEAKSAKV